MALGAYRAIVLMFLFVIALRLSSTTPTKPDVAGQGVLAAFFIAGCLAAAKVADSSRKEKD